MPKMQNRAKPPLVEFQVVAGFRTHPKQGKTACRTFEPYERVANMKISDKTKRIWIFFLTLVLLPLPWQTVTAQTKLKPRQGRSLSRQLNGMIGPRDAVMIAAPSGNLIVSANSDTLLIPASILKVLTALTALHHLGVDYRFKTAFHLTTHNPFPNLAIKGYGDPLLVSEQVARLSGRLAEHLSEIGDIVVDASYFSSHIAIPGRHNSPEPYDAPNGALCVNFNTVAFERRNGLWASAEPQTPLLPFVLPRIKASGLSAGRITMAGHTAEGALYAGELFKFFLEKEGVGVHGTIVPGEIEPSRDRLVLLHRSEFTLTVVIQNLLEFSNNFIANQLMLALGAHQEGPPATVEKGLAVLQDYYHRVLGIEHGVIAEASGISRKNRLTATALMTILKQFYPYHELMRRDGRQWYKTGTLNGIRTRAGFIDASDGGHYQFVVMINTPGKPINPIIRLMEKNLK